VGIAEGFDSFAQGLTGAIHGGAGILEHLAERFHGLDRRGAIGHIAVCVESIMAGLDGSPGIVGSLRSRDNGGKGIQRCLDGGSIPAFLTGPVNQRLCLGEKIIGFGKPVALALEDSLRAGPDLFQALIAPCWNRDYPVPCWNRDYPVPYWNRDYPVPCWNRDYPVGRRVGWWGGFVLETGRGGAGGGEGDQSDSKDQGCQAKFLEDRDKHGHIFTFLMCLILMIAL
jgi:hypothetical protein